MPALEILLQPGTLVLGLADGLEPAAAELRAGVVEVVAPPVGLETGHHVGKPLDQLSVPPVDFELGEVADRFLGLELRLEDGDSPNEEAVEGDAALPEAPGIADELAPKVPLLAPGRAEAGRGLVVLAVDSAGVRADHVASATVHEREAGFWMGDWKRMGETHFDSSSPAGKNDWEACILVQRVIVEIERIGSHCALERLGGVCWALERSVALNQRTHTEGGRFFGWLLLDEERLS